MCQIFRLGNGSVIRILGKDRATVLNNLATQDLRNLAPGQSLETFITDPKGKVFGHGLVVSLDQALFFVTVADQADKLIKHFDRYIIREDASLENASYEFDFWLFPEASAMLNFIGRPVEPGQALIGQGNAHGAIGFWAPWVAANSGILLVPTNLVSDFRELASGMLIESDFVHRSQWESMRIVQFWPWYGQDMDEKNLPQELDRDDLAISFKKGCYLGQETIARLDALGQVQKKLVRLSIDGSLLPSLKDDFSLKSNGSEVGSLRSVAKLSTGHIVGLGYVKRSHFAPGSQLTLGDSSVSVVVRSSFP